MAATGPMANKAPGGPTPLQRELEAMVRTAPRPQPARAPARVEEAPKVATNSITVEAAGRQYTLTTDMLQTPRGRVTIREFLTQRIAELRAYPKSPYNDRRHPDHAAFVRDVYDAYRFSNSEMPDQGGF